VLFRCHESHQTEPQKYCFVTGQPLVPLVLQSHCKIFISPWNNPLKPAHFQYQDSQNDVVLILLFFYHFGTRSIGTWHVGYFSFSELARRCPACFFRGTVAWPNSIASFFLSSLFSWLICERAANTPTVACLYTFNSEKDHVIYYNAYLSESLWE